MFYPILGVKLFLEENIFYFPAFAFVILLRNVHICKYQQWFCTKSTIPAVNIKGGDVTSIQLQVFPPLEVIMAICGNLSTVWQKSLWQI